MGYLIHLEHGVLASIVAAALCMPVYAFVMYIMDGSFNREHAASSAFEAVITGFFEGTIVSVLLSSSGDPAVCTALAFPFLIDTPGLKKPQRLVLTVAFASVAGVAGNHLIFPGCGVVVGAATVAAVSAATAAVTTMRGQSALS